MEERKNNNTGLGRVIEILLICLIAFMPFAFGAVEAWSEQVVVVLSSAILFLFLLQKILNPQEGFTRTFAYLPLLLLFFIIVLQIIPLPQGIVSALSPQTVSLKKELLDSTGGTQQNWDKLTISFYPSATKHNLRIIFAIVSIFMVVLNNFKSYEQIKRLLKAIVCIGASVAALAIIQNVIGNNKIYWFVPAPLKANSGPFINHSHFGQFMNLSIGAAAALLLLKLREDFRSRRTTAANIFEYFDTSQARGLWSLAAMISISAAAVFASLTRGGMVSMLMAMCAVVLLLAMRRSLRQHGWLVFVIALCAFVCLLYTGFDAVYDRFATSSLLDSYQTRIEIIKDLLNPARQFAVLGTGLGTHSVIYPMFQSISTVLRFRFAENEYIQLLEEAGITGFVIMLIFGAIVAVNFVKAIRNKESDISITAYGLGFGLIAILIHSVSDFGQHLPANAALSAIFCALIITLGQSKKDNISIKPVRIGAIILLVLTTAVSVWSINESQKTRIAEGWWEKASVIEKKLVADNIQGSDDDFERLISYGTKAVQAQPGNIEYRYWLNVWRWWEAGRQIDSDVGGLSNEGMEKTYGIVADLKDARFLCPTFGPIYCLMGQLQKFILFEPVGEDNIRKGVMLEPNNELALFAAGCLDISEDKPVESFEKFRKSIQLRSTFFKDIVKIYIEQAKRPDLAIEIAADNIQQLKYVEAVLAQSEDFKPYAETAQLKMLEAAESAVLKNAAALDDLIFLGDYYKNSEPEKAAEYLSAALLQDYGNSRLRLKYAEVLAETGRFEEAIQQARICLKLNPGSKQAKRLIAELSVRPELIKKRTENVINK
ncbi:MAG: O-antigen ligase family protein [Phycisphaerae bacterium]|nr:O-antigen ligase family protein [Phycisphaerae bacterium]